MSERDREGRIELHYAAAEGDVVRVGALLEDGSDIDAVDHAMFTPLHLASQEFRPDVVRLLIDAGATVDPRNRFGGTPLWVAVMHAQGRVDVVQLLLNAGADPDCKNENGVSPRDIVSNSSSGALHPLFET